MRELTVAFPVLSLTNYSTEAAGGGVFGNCILMPTLTCFSKQFNESICSI